MASFDRTFNTYGRDADNGQPAVPIFVTIAACYRAFMACLHRRSSLFAAFVVFTAALGAGCGQPESASVDSGDVVVTVDSVAGTVVIARGGENVVVIAAGDVGVKDGDAFFDMQFGMFDIQEDNDPFAFGDTLRISAVGDDDTIDVEVLAGEDIIATGRVAVVGDEVDVTWTATSGDRVLIKTPCEADHHFIGLGAQSADVDHRGQIVPLWVSEQGIGKSDTDELPVAWQLVGRRHTTHVPMPAFLRSDAVAFVVDTHAFSRFDFCASESDVTSFEVWEKTLRLRVLPSSSVLAAQQALSEALGRPRLLPPYVFAPWNDAIFSEQHVRDFAQFLRDEEIPSSVIWSEDWRGGESSGGLYRLDEDWRLDRALYPTYEDMTADLRADGFAHQVYFNTFVTEGGDVFDEITQAGHDVRVASTGETFLFTGADRNFSPTALLDLTNEAAWNYARDEHLKEALRLGARGWMVDYAEWMPVEDAAIAEGAPDLVHNEYPVLWSKLNREAVEQSDLLDEVVLYSRAGHLGSPAVVDVMWAGDQRTTFDVDDGLPTILPIGIGLSVTGFTYFAHDIGGYQSSTNAPTTKELFFRWTELGALSPVMRTHHGTHAALNHHLDTDAETTAHFKRYAELHIRLYPYLRALAVADATADTAMAAGHGRLPLWVPLPVLFPADDALWSIKDQVLLGPSLLVAPVMLAGGVSRRVVLPTGRFVFFPTPGAPEGAAARRLDDVVGPQDITVAAALGEIPILMPAGAIVPMTATAAQTLLEVDGDLADLSSTTGDREVIVALGAAGRFVEEDGATYVLEGTGTTRPAGADDTGAVDVVGNQTIEGSGFTLRLSGHPATRRTRLVFR